MENLEDLSDFAPDSSPDVCEVLDVTDVLDSPSSVVTEFCQVFPVALIGKVLCRSPFLSPKSEHIVVQVRKK